MLALFTSNISELLNSIYRGIRSALDEFIVLDEGHVESKSSGCFGLVKAVVANVGAFFSGIGWHTTFGCFILTTVTDELLWVKIFGFCNAKTLTSMLSFTAVFQEITGRLSLEKSGTNMPRLSSNIEVSCC